MPAEVIDSGVTSYFVCFAQVRQRTLLLLLSTSPLLFLVLFCFLPLLLAFASSPFCSPAFLRLSALLAYVSLCFFFSSSVFLLSLWYSSSIRTLRFFVAPIPSCMESSLLLTTSAGCERKEEGKCLSFRCQWKQTNKLLNYILRKKANKHEQTISRSCLLVDEVYWDPTTQISEKILELEGSSLFHLYDIGSCSSRFSRRSSDCACQNSLP